MHGQAALTLLFVVGVPLVLALDLGVLQRRAHVVGFREAAAWCLCWAALALGFAYAVLAVHGRRLALEFIGGYLLELSLSVDNMFVFVMIFHYFGIPSVYQSRVLKWGILGAIVMRFVFIFVGISLVNAFSWMLYVFGLLLIVTGVKMATSQDEEEPDLRRNPALRLFKRYVPMTLELKGQAFFHKERVWRATPLLAALLIVEVSDVVFALDSIPAILGITRDSFIVYSSNIFAIMGLRSLYFLLANLVGMFRYLKLGISVILVLVGLKMLAPGWGYHAPIGLSLAVIVAVLAVSVAASWIAGPEEKG